MKKILILFLFLSACGYQPLYNANLINVEFNKINLSGDFKINRKIISTLNINESNNTNKEISIDSSQSITVTSETLKDNQPHIEQALML